MAKYGLHSTHVSRLYYLHHDETATDLCEHCEQHKATISRVLAYLEEQGFLAPRKQGKRFEGALEAVSSELTEEYRQNMYESLNIIRSGLESLLKKNGE